MYDPDGHIVELGEPMDVVVRRCLDGGMTLAQAAERVGMPLEAVDIWRPSVDPDPTPS